MARINYPVRPIPNAQFETFARDLAIASFNEDKTSQQKLFNDINKRKLKYWELTAIMSRVGWLVTCLKENRNELTGEPNE